MISWACRLCRVPFIGRVTGYNLVTWPERRLALLLLLLLAVVSAMAGVCMFSLCMPWLITRSLPWETVRPAQPAAEQTTKF